MTICVACLQAKARKSKTETVCPVNDSEVKATHPDAQHCLGMERTELMPPSPSAVVECECSNISTIPERECAVVGMVSIVGAGPGPADLLTVRALRRIQQAEVVIHDRLLSPEVLDLVPAGAIKIGAGKAPGHHSMPQRDIEDSLVRWCRSGKRVVRLKGGDPFVFGRGGEEIWALARAGITAEIIPGITAASGCAASAGIPLTHRGLATTCTFVPGQLSDDGKQIDWAGLARPMQTLVFYMAVQNVKKIARQLILHGMLGSMPAAVIFDGTRTTQRVIATTLQSLLDCDLEYDRRPGLVIVGETVRLGSLLACSAVPGVMPESLRT